MLYALMDYSNNKSNKISFEEILGEVKVCVPQKIEKKKNAIKKVLKIIDQYGVKNIIFSRELQKNIEFYKLIQDNKGYVVTGRRMGKVLLMKVVEEMAKYTRYQKENMSLLLFMNEYSMENIDLIEWIASEVKELNLISRNYSKYEKTSNTLFEKYGFIVKLYDEECRTEFKKVNMVINLDFKEEIFQKFNINKNSIIISLNEEIRKLSKGFNGIIVNDIDISGLNDSTIKYRSLALCEAQIYKPLRRLKDNERIFNSEKYILNGYMGKNGKITVEDFEKIGKNFSLDKRQANV